MKETVENEDLHKAVLNKTMTTQEQCVKYDFVAPLRENSREFNVAIQIKEFLNSGFEGKATYW